MSIHRHTQFWKDNLFFFFSKRSSHSVLKLQILEREHSILTRAMGEISFSDQAHSAQQRNESLVLSAITTGLGDFSYKNNTTCSQPRLFRLSPSLPDNTDKHSNIVFTIHLCGEHVHSCTRHPVIQVLMVCVVNGHTVSTIPRACARGAMCTCTRQTS